MSHSARTNLSSIQHNALAVFLCLSSFDFVRFMLHIAQYSRYARNEITFDGGKRKNRDKNQLRNARKSFFYSSKRFDHTNQRVCGEAMHLSWADWCFYAALDSNKNCVEPHNTVNKLNGAHRALKRNSVMNPSKRLIYIFQYPNPSISAVLRRRQSPHSIFHSHTLKSTNDTNDNFVQKLSE